MQQIMYARDGFSDLDEYIERHPGPILAVCGRSALGLGVWEHLQELAGERLVRFSEFEPNPSYESVVKGVKLYRREGCGLIIAVGGGSAMDVAKCIKLFAKMPDDRDHVEQEIVPNDIPLLAVPTTAGTGSEATRYAIIYYGGSKLSVTHESCIPEAVYFDPEVLLTLPEYHKKAAMLDALCHGVESWWSVHSTEESRMVAERAVRRIMANIHSFMAGEPEGLEQMQLAAFEAGQAINITATTAGHALCYKLTQLYGTAHGHAAALCVSVLYPFMYENLDKCTDARGPDHLRGVLEDIGEALGEGADTFPRLLRELDMPAPEDDAPDYGLLVGSVNVQRLSNNPVALGPEDIEGLYRSIIGGKNGR